jgi:uncharacterized repeat protein (TIGR03943 family)
LLERLIFRWRGVLLTLIGVSATLWLGVTGRLGLYIHPRYFVFTMVMAAIAGVLVIAAFAVLPASTGAAADTDAPHDDESDEHVHERRRWPALAAIGSAAIIAVATVTLLVLPPSSLSTGGVTGSDLSAGVTSVSVADDATSEQLVGGDYASFTVKDWAALLRQGVDEQFLSGKQADVVGFITPDEDDPDNQFYLARFAVTCCAVDAQPVGVPVYLPGWADQYSADDWLQISGSFVSNPSALSASPTVLEPDSVAVVDEPNEPYVY